MTTTTTIPEQGNVAGPLNIPTVELKPDNWEMPLVGFGLWKVPQEKTADTVYGAIKMGYRLFDGAADYGNEKEAGEGIRRAIKDGLVKRNDLFITTKIWNTFHHPDALKNAAKMQLEHWGLDYFDLLLIHFPISLKFIDPKVKYPPEWWDESGKVVPGNICLADAYRALEEVHEQRLAKNIGLSNVQGSMLIDITMGREIHPAVLQIEHHPYLVQEPLIRLAKRLNVAVTGYSSFGPASYHELENVGALRTKLLFDQDVVKKAAEKHKVSPAQVLLRWATQRGIAVIPKSSNPQRAKENLECCKFDLDPEEIDAITKLDMGLRFNDPAEIDDRLAIFA